jgi:hypothetical protein
MSLFKTRGISVDIDLTTVVLEYDFNASDKETNLIMWHCPVCANPVIQFGGRMVAILPGIVPSSHPPLLALCQKCKHKYLFTIITTR